MATKLMDPALARGRVVGAAAASLVLVVAACATAEAGAEPAPRAVRSGLILGPFEAHTQLTVRNRYSSNVFQSPVAPVADLDTEIKPELQFALRSARSTLQTDGSFRETRYWGLADSSSATQSFRAWHANGQAAHEFRAGTRIQTSGRVERTSDPILVEYTAGAERTPRWRYEAGAAAIQPVGVGLIETSAEYGLAIDRYLGAASVFDRNHHEFQIQGLLRPYPELGVFARGGYGITFREAPAAVSLSSRADALDAQLGVAGSLSPLYRFDVVGGARFRGYSSGESRIRPSARLALRWFPGARSQLGAQGQIESLEGVISDEIVIARGIVDAERKLGRGVRAKLDGALWRTVYAPSDVYDRTDVTGRVRFLLGWSPGASWLDVDLSYEYERRRSDRPTERYRDHRTSLAVAASY